MPQMMPLNWLSMFFSMNMLLLLLSMIVFNLIIPTLDNKYMSMKKTIPNKWMW